MNKPSLENMISFRVLYLPLYKIFTLLELLIVVAIIGILASLLLPALSVAKEKAREGTCRSNLKQLGAGLMFYMQDYSEWFPLHNYNDGTYGTSTNTTWFGLLNTIINNQNIFKCPSDTKFLFRTDRLSYGYNHKNLGEGTATGAVIRKKLSQIKKPSATILNADSYPVNGYCIVRLGTSGYDITYSIGMKHLNTANVLFVDNHIQRYSRSEIDDGTSNTEYFWTGN